MELQVKNLYFLVNTLYWKEKAWIGTGPGIFGRVAETEKPNQLLKRTRFAKTLPKA